MNDQTVKLIEDRLSIKTTQRLRRYMKPQDISQFFAKHKHTVERLEQEYIKELDKLINEFLSGKL